MKSATESLQLDSPPPEPAESEPELEGRLSKAVAAVILQARAARLDHFRYCSRPEETSSTRCEFERRLSKLECQLQEWQCPSGLQTAILERLQLLATLSQAPRDLPNRRRIRLQELVREGLAQLR